MAASGPRMLGHGLIATLGVTLLLAGLASAEAPKPKKPGAKQATQAKQIEAAKQKAAFEAKQAAKRAARAAEAKAAAEAARKQEEAAAQPAVSANQRQAPKAAPVDRAATEKLARVIDEQIERKLKQEGLSPAPAADDAEFLRRVYLDLVGVIPTADEAKAFLDSRDPKKRAVVIDTLLESPRFGQRMADAWLGQMLPKTSDNRRVQPQPLREWLVQSFNDNKPWDEFARDVVTATGKMTDNGAVVFTLANFSPDKLTDQSARLFLGVRIECAQCHNHPFVDWKQDEYWSMAAFFMKVRLDTRGNVRTALNNGGTPGVVENTNGRVSFNKNQLPEAAKFLPAKFLQGDSPKIATADPARPVLADWMTRKDNPFFARAMVNKTWAQMFGKGIVNPVDDMHDGNKPSHPELLTTLAEQFASGGFDVKGLLRGIANSRTYQRSSRPTNPSQFDHSAEFYAHMPVKVMTPFQLYDSLLALSNRNERAEGGRRRPDGNNRNVRGGPREAFANFFMTNEVPDPTSYEAGIPQALRLMNSGMISNPGSVLQAMPRGSAPAKVIEQMYLASLSRRPTADETQRLQSYISQTGDANAAYSDIFWALLNSSEFCLNH